MKNLGQFVEISTEILHKLDLGRIEKSLIKQIRHELAQTNSQQQQKIRNVKSHHKET